MDILRREFKEYDVDKKGNIPTKAFTSVLSKYGVGTSGVRSIARRFSNQGSVDYSKFLDFFEKTRTYAYMTKSS